jgi:hypothetical protein
MNHIRSNYRGTLLITISNFDEGLKEYCVCVCDRQRERERECESESELGGVAGWDCTIYGVAVSF